MGSYVGVVVVFSELIVSGDSYVQTGRLHIYKAHSLMLVNTCLLESSSQKALQSRSQCAFNLNLKIRSRFLHQLYRESSLTRQ